MHYQHFPESGSLTTLYHEAWKTFYSFENMKRVLSRAAPRNYWNIMRNFIWYKNAAILERRHPMMAGFFRRKSRRAMRHGVPVPTRWTFAKMRVGEIASYLQGMVQLLWEMQELWLSTRPRSPAEEQLVHEMTRIHKIVQRRLTVSELQLAYQRAKTHLPALKVPSRFTLYWQKWNLFYAGRRVFTRADIDQSWSRVVTWVRRYKFPCVSPVRLLTTLWLELQISTMFAHELLQSRSKKLGFDA